MTLPASFPLSMSQIATELGLSLPLSINHPWVIALAGKSSLPVSFSDLLGKTGRFDGSRTPNFFGSPFNVWRLTLSAAPFFGGVMVNFEVPGTISGPTVGAQGTLSFSAAPGWSGNILLKNNTTLVNMVLAKSSSTAWIGATPANLIRSGQADSFTILPSA